MHHGLCLNGIDGSTGDYLFPHLTPEMMARVAQGERLDPRELDELRAKYFAEKPHLGVRAGVDPNDLAEAGWGIILAHDTPGEIREALEPLLEHRRRQATARGDYFRQFDGPDGYQPGELSREFLARHGVAPGQPANPERMPYYLLIVADPEAIPYRFQYQLDVTYAVGRLHFDRPEEYERYAQNVVRAETALAHSRRVAFFGVKNDDDGATRLSADHLVAPLSKKLADEFPDWSVQTVLADDATKARLHTLLGGEDTPAVLVTAGHGMGFRNGDPRQRPQQGALLCQDWPGPLAWKQRIPEDFYYAGEDLDPSRPLGGVLAFLFACYGAGTPRTDDFAGQALRTPVPVAPHAFVGRLPQRLLSHPAGGALAVVGHVDRAWSYSFFWPRLGEQLEVFKSTLHSVLTGARVGHAVEFFNNLYAALSTELQDEKEDVAYGKVADDAALAGLWTARNDARNFVVLGDPAVRLAHPRAMGT